MRRVLMVTVLGAVLVMVFAGVALAVTFITCDGGRCEGTKRADIIDGSDLRDRIFALGGYDEVFSYGGGDELHGADGGDILVGGPGHDTYYGGDESDLLGDEFRNPGNDVMNGGDGADLISAGAGDDVLRGEVGNESLGTFPSMSGDDGADVLQGGKGGDSMAGGLGRDRHYGGKEDDLINAAMFEDFFGPDARDLVDCGEGSDRAIVLPNDRVLANCEDVERARVLSGVSAQEAKAAAEEEQQQALERFLAEREANR